MCTVTYLPLSNSSFILTHNRDEHHTRTIALLPDLKTVNGADIIFPTDLQGGGTWIATSSKFTLCILNGGFEKHIPSPPYRHSRGLVILDFFKFGNVADVVHGYDVTNIEPFTLIVVEHPTQVIHQLVHDGRKIHHSPMNPALPHIWSSSTLYSAADREKRQQWFNDWCTSNREYSQSDIIGFHKQKKDTNEQEGIMINREERLFTVSLTSVLKTAQHDVSLLYEDFLQHKHKKLVIR